MGLVIALGGSVLFSNKSYDLNHTFVNAFFECCKNHVAKYSYFVIVTGGGAIARSYQYNARRYTDSSTDLDTLGIDATQLNAKLVSIVAKKYGPVQLLNPSIGTEVSSLSVDYNANYIISGGFREGVSTDAIATYLVSHTGAKTLINISDIPYIYDKDPKKFSEAVPYQQLDWQQYRHIIGNKWRPGTHLPFDPFAAQHAQENGITVHFVAPDREQIDTVFNEMPHQGTTISSM